MTTRKKPPAKRRTGGSPLVIMAPPPLVHAGLVALAEGATRALLDSFSSRRRLDRLIADAPTWPYHHGHKAGCTCEADAAELGRLLASRAETSRRPLSVPCPDDDSSEEG